MRQKKRELARNLGFIEAMTLGGGTMIGAGIFILPGIAAANAGPASSISFVIGGLVALLAAISLSELATGMPVAGGSYHYVNRALGSFFGNIVGWGLWTGLMFASAFYMIGFGQYLVTPLPFFDGRLPVVSIGLVGLLLLVGINYYGTEESSKAQNWMIAAEVIVIIIFLAATVFFVDTSNLRPFAPTGASGIIATTGIIFVTFLGFEIIATVAEEIKNPGWTIPVTMILSVVAVTILYAMVMIIATGVIPYEELAESLVPVSDVAMVSMGTVGVIAIVAAAAIAAISSSNSSVLSAARVVYAMGRDHLVSDWMNATHRRFGTPHRAVLVTGGVTAALVLAGLLVEDIIALLAEVASFSFLLSYALVHVAVVVIRRAGPSDYEPDFKIPSWLYPTVPVLGIVLSLVVISQMEPVVIAMGLGISLLAVAWYFVYSRLHVREPSLVGSAIVGEAARRVREPGEFLNAYRIVVPVANPATQQQLLRVAAADAHTHKEARISEIVALNILKVPQQASLEQNMRFERERIDLQHALLQSAEAFATELGVNLRTRALLGRNVAKTVLSVLEEERADELFLGWTGKRSTREHILGSTLDPILRGAGCQVTLFHAKKEDTGTVVALAGPGPHSPFALRRAYEISLLGGEKPTFVNVQPITTTDEKGEAIDPQERGERTIHSLAAKGGLTEEQYVSRVLVDDDIRKAILAVIHDYDTVCVGMSTQTVFQRVFYGSLAERIAQSARGNVVMVRGPQEKRWSIHDALIERFAKREPA